MEAASEPASRHRPAPLVPRDRRQSVPRDPPGALGFGAAFADPPDGAAALAADSAGSVDISRALRRLPHDIRLAVVLRFYLDLSFDEVAATSGCSLEAARSRVRRGLTALAATLIASEERS